MMELLKQSKSSSSFYKVDSGGTCFFCLKLGDLQNIESNKNNYFRLILRYLQFPPWKICPEDETKGFKENVQVNLCHECQGILHEFGEIYIIFEETVLHLNSCITKIHGVMNHQKQEGGDVVELEHDKFEGLRNFREEVMLKCEEKLQLSMPRVRLERLPNLKRKLPSTSFSATPEFRVKDEYEPPAQDEDEQEQAEDMFEDMDVDDRMSLSPSPSPFPPASELSMEQLPTAPELSKKAKFSFGGQILEGDELHVSQPNQNQLQLKCQYCNRIFNGTNMKEIYRLHLVNLHAFHFFANIQKEDIPLNKFVRMIDHVINLSNTNGSCSFCPKSLKLKRNFLQKLSVKRHLIQIHRRPLEKALIKIQDNPKLLKTSFTIEKYKECKKKRFEQTEAICQFCEKKFVGRGRRPKLSLHLTGSHMHELLVASKKEKVSHLQFKIMIDQLVQFYIQDLNNCSLCPTSFQQTRSGRRRLLLKRHLFGSHRQILEEALKQVQDNPELLQTSFKILNEKKSTTKIIKVSPVLCNYCGQKYKGPRKDEFFKNHLVSQHSEHFFSKIKKENISTPEFVNMINSIFKFHLNKIDKNKCTLCPTMCQGSGGSRPSSQSLAVRHHLLEKHLETLEEALMKVQDNPELLNTCFRIQEEDSDVQEPSKESVTSDLKHVLCQYCGKDFEGKARNFEFKIHLARYHVHHYFPDIKKEDLSEAEFIDMIKHILLLCINKENNCSLCHKLYKMNKKQTQSIQVKLHLLQDHRRTLEKALIKCQDNPELLNAPFKIEEDEEDKAKEDAVVNPSLCQYCGFKFEGPKNFVRYQNHIVSFHKEHFFPNVERGILTKTKFVKMIDLVLLLHMRNGNCTLCRTCYARKSKSKQLLRVKRHLLEDHRGAIEEAVVEALRRPDCELPENDREAGEGPSHVLDESSVDDVACKSPEQLTNVKCVSGHEEEEETLFDLDLTISDSRPSSPESNAESPNQNRFMSESDQICCKYCHQIFKGRNLSEKFKKHLITSHINNYLPNVKKENCTQAEFIEMVDHVLQLCIKKDNDNCLLCPKIYKNKFRPLQLLNVKLHLLEEHQGTVKRAVGKVQVTPELLNTTFDVLNEDDDHDAEEEEEVKGLPALMDELSENDMEEMLMSPGYQPDESDEPDPLDDEMDETFEPESRTNSEPEAVAPTTKGYYCTSIFNEGVPFGVKDILCQYCGKKFEGCKKNEKFKFHLVIHHISQFFSDIPKGSLSDPEFIEMIGKVINLCMKEDNCSLCSRVYKIKHRPMKLLYLKVHLLQDHLKTLEKALVKVLDNPKLLLQKPGFTIEEDKEDKKLPKIMRNQRQVLCQDCGSQFIGNRRTASFLQHLAIHHIEQFFPNVKGEKVTKAEFLNMINHVINLFIKEDNCSLCSKVFRISSRATQLLHVRNHLLRDHLKTLEKALIKVHDNPKLLKTSFDIVEDENDKIDLSRLSRVSRTNPLVVVCKYCEMKFEGKGWTPRHRLHLMTCHKSHFFANVRKENVTEAEFDKMIDQVLHIHQKKDRCTFCLRPFQFKTKKSKLYSTNIHFIQNHQKEMQKELVALQEKSGSKFIPEIDYDSPSIPRGLWRQLGIIHPTGEDANCPFCNRLFRAKEVLKFHVFCRHKQHLFPKRREELVTEKQFEIIISHLVFMTFIKKCTCTLCSNSKVAVDKVKGVKEVKEKEKASIALNRHNWLHRMKMHLFVKHYGKVMKRLEELQTDKKLLKKIDHCLLACKCGVLCMTKEEVKRHKRSCGASCAYWYNRKL